jgi:hypothetical protein
MRPQITASRGKVDKEHYEHRLVARRTGASVAIPGLPPEAAGYGELTLTERLWLWQLRPE